MNYGYWNTSDTLLKANKSLINLILEKSRLLDKKNVKLLDVGCGYGEQDFEWISQLDPSNKITAIDISDTQIKLAKEKCIRSGLQTRLFFDKGDAMLINKKFANKEFNTILSVESAFHYSDRIRFFQSVYDTLEDNGTFVICDIVLQDNYKPGILNSGFLHIFSDFLKIPSQNLIRSSEWEKSIKDTGLEIVECIDITDKTFKPYYNNFFHKYMENTGMPSIIASTMYNFFAYVQPFSYKVAVCTKLIV
jgi:cyclopropane fatty-acyl-phospholipid synthase-like methyltransferase